MPIRRRLPGSRYDRSPSQIIRKSIARHFTIINEKARKRVGEKIPKDSGKLAQTLRNKLTRAIRRRLTLKQRNTRLVKVQKRLSHFPLRKFGLKA